jgi:squalene-hopene/tetraprenyl-beta-curcumene cyclase
MKFQLWTSIRCHCLTALYAIACVAYFASPCAAMMNTAPPIDPSKLPANTTADILQTQHIAPSTAARATTLNMPAATVSFDPPPPVIRRVTTNASLVPISPATFAHALEAIDKGILFLKSSQSASGAWMEGVGAAPTATVPPTAAVGGDTQTKTSGATSAVTNTAASAAVTALVVRAFAQRGLNIQGDAALDRATTRLVELVTGKNGFEPDSSGGMATYVASCTAMGLAALQEAKYEMTLAAALAWIRESQWDENEGIVPTQDWYGGVGYGSKGRPDLSNTQLMLDALHESNATAKDPSVERAVIFLTRCQNLKSTNAAVWAQAGANDGGMVYTPANDGESFASEMADEGRAGEKMPAGTRALRSYGSMTYAAYKSMLFAGLSKNDPRVQAAQKWIESNFTFSENPGLGQQGYYYYIHAAARAMLACGNDTLTDTAGTKHTWREELIDSIIGRQRPNGSWQNPETRWMEDSPDLATVFAVLALEEAIKPVRVSQ